ncbi:hypothetical protein [Allopontixanthobacter sp.]|uniref:hypothetical protein n=1 Tax=Allopontixanthobacter sp. TaxID=2906452 RepID=UPI002ABAE7E1|nr:hypothetical protein [Allopontixanthobacter sp.]MDZ4306269.1 hypothetical protein [Allopontixanthobacter sp.]
MKRILAAIAALAALTAAPSAARDSLGIFSGWGAFRDPSVPRCYAITKPRPSTRQRDYDPYVSIGTWPTRGVRGQIHLRLTREMAPGKAINLLIGGKNFTLAGGGGDAWARDRAMDAAIVAAIRSAGSMTVTATDTRGRRFSSTYDLSGAATAMDAATVGCAKR